MKFCDSHANSLAEGHGTPSPRPLFASRITRFRTPGRWEARFALRRSRIPGKTSASRAKRATVGHGGSRERSSRLVPVSVYRLQLPCASPAGYCRQAVGCGFAGFRGVK